MNERIKRLKEDYERTENKIVSLQEKNKKLAEKIRQLENAEIVGAVRDSGCSIDELLSLLGKSEKPTINYGAKNTDNYDKKDLEEIKNEI